MIYSSSSSGKAPMILNMVDMVAILDVWCMMCRTKVSKVKCTAVINLSEDRQTSSS